MPKVASTTAPSPVSVLLNSVRAQPKFPVTTLPDLINLNLKPTRQWEYRSYMSAAARLLRKGSEFEDLAGTKIVPAERKTGAQPMWAEGIEPKPNKIALPDWSKSQEIVAIGSKYSTLGLLKSQTQIDALATIAKSGKKVYEASTLLMIQNADKALEERALREDAESRAIVAERVLGEKIKEMMVGYGRELGWTPPASGPTAASPN